MGNPGASAPSSYTVNYDALLSTTLFAYRSTLVDNIFKYNAFLAALRKFNGVEYQDGGERVAQPLMYESNDTVKSYKGYEQLTIKPQDGITTAFFEWAEIAATISISRREERQNSGEAALLKLLEKKIMQAEMGIKAAVNSQLVLGTVSGGTFVPGNDAKDLLPIGYFLRYAPNTDPTTGGNVGNIAAATYSWWRPNICTLGAAADTGHKFGLTVTTYAGLKVGLHRMYNYCTRGADGSAPNIVLTDQVTYETYENALDQQVRYTNQSLGDMGFDNIKLKGATMIWDELVPDLYTGTAALTTGTAFFLNTQFWKLVIDKQTDFITTPFIEPENQTAKTAKVLFMGQSTVSNPRKLGAATRISQSIVA
jgi:hypothetical protein